MNQGKPEVLSYLLRLWRENDQSKPVWRASLKEVRSGEQIVVTNLEALFACLRQQADVGLDRTGDRQE